MTKDLINMVKNKKLIKKNIIVIIPILLAIISCIFVPIDGKYFGYFEYKTLLSLFAMLTVVAGLKNTNILHLISKKMIMIFKNRRSVIIALIFGTFLLDMIVANDMSLITFLPLSYIVLKSTGNSKYLAFTFIMQNIAANMGGMITPYGNPQNIYLYSYFNISNIDFVTTLLPQFICTIILLIICCMFIKPETIALIEEKDIKINNKKLIIYTFLFFLTILSIFRIIPYWITISALISLVLLFDIKRFKKVDYGLLLIFIAFFIFSGNIARIPIIKDLIISSIDNNTLIAGIISCQFISNVPTAIFLSKFTDSFKELLISVNIGSLGIIISSLASLITIKEFLKHRPKKIFHYLLLFSLINTGFLLILYLVTILTLG